VDFEFRFVPAWMLMKRKIAEDYLGRMRFVSVSWLVDSLADPDARRFGWIHQSELGGGTLGSLGSHVFDYLEWFFGDIVEATGFVSIGVPKRLMPGSRRKAQVTAEDTFGADLRFASGLCAAVEVCTVGWHRYGHRILAFGDQGTLDLRQESASDYIHQASLRAGRAGDPTLELVPVPEDLELPREYPDGRVAPFIQVIDALVRAIEGAPRPGDPDLDCGLRAQRVMDAVSRAHEKGGWMPIDRRRARSSTI
jgi:predicted dehydrogenase